SSLVLPVLAAEGRAGNFAPDPDVRHCKNAGIRQCCCAARPQTLHSQTSTPWQKAREFSEGVGATLEGVDSLRIRRLRKNPENLPKALSNFPKCAHFCFHVCARFEKRTARQ